MRRPQRSIRAVFRASLLAPLVGAALASASTGCITWKSEHDELAAEVLELKKRVALREEELAATLSRAEAQMTDTQAKADKIEKILGSSQATLGVRVDHLETETAQVRGIAEDSVNELARLSQNIEEVLAQLDARLAKLESDANEKNAIPEGKQALFAEAEAQLKKQHWKQARQLYRIYLSRYPKDPKEAEVRFKVGQTLFSERDYRSALGEFYWIVQNAADTSVIHDALYYSGLAFAKLGQCEKALAYFGALAKEDSKAPKRYKDASKKQIKSLESDDGRMCTDGKPAADPS